MLELRAAAKAVVEFFLDAPDTDDYEKIGGQLLAQLHHALSEPDPMAEAVRLLTGANRG